VAPPASATPSTAPAPC